MNLIDIAAIIGLSSIISALVTFVLDNLKKKQGIRFEKLFEEKYRRYNHLLAHMLIIIDLSTLHEVTTLDEEHKAHYLSILKEKGNDFLKKYLLNETKNYINFYCLFASDNVIKLLNAFLYTPTEKRYIEIAKAMKKDLWK